MRIWTRRLLIAVLALGGTLWLACAFQTDRTARLVADLTTRAHRPFSTTTGPQVLDSLPAPVRRYLAHVLPADHRNLRLATYTQTGQLRTDPRIDRWSAFVATQVISPDTSEFLWNARVSVAPLLHVRVRDSLLQGQGAGQVTLLSAIPVASASGGLEMDSGALHRFLAEAVWYPTALLPSPRLRWQAIDDSRALATLANGTTTVSLEFRFNADNEVTGIHTPGRWGRFDGEYRQAAWEGKFRHYVRHQGVLIPSEGEVGWYIDGQWQSVWRGRVASIAMTFQSPVESRAPDTQGHEPRP